MAMANVLAVSGYLIMLIGVFTIVLGFLISGVDAVAGLAADYPSF
jgi:hypothetical protein